MSPCGASRGWTLLLGLAGLAASPAAAEGLSITGFLSQRADVRDGGSGDSEEALRSVTDLGLRLRDDDGRTSWTFAPGVRGVLSTDSDETGRVTPRFNGAFLRAGPLTTFTATLAVVPDFTDETQFEDTGRTETDVLQISTTGRMGLSHRLGPLDSVSLGLSVRDRAFVGDPETLSASRSFGVDGGWRTQFTPLTTASVSPNLRFFTSDAANGSDGVTFSAPLGLETRLGSGVQLSGSLGPSVTRSSRAGADDTLDFGLVGGLNIAHQTDDIRYSAGLNQTVDQNSDGDLENRTSLNFGVGYAVNRLSRLSLDGALGLQTALGDAGEEGGGDRRTFSLAPSWRYDLTEDWALSVGYRLRLSDDDEGQETSNSAFLQLSRGLSLLP